MASTIFPGIRVYNAFTNGARGQANPGSALFLMLVGDQMNQAHMVLRMMGVSVNYVNFVNFWGELSRATVERVRDGSAVNTGLTEWEKFSIAMKVYGGFDPENIGRFIKDTVEIARQLSEAEKKLLSDLGINMDVIIVIDPNQLEKFDPNYTLPPELKAKIEQRIWTNRQPWCFGAGTPVLMGDGNYKPIEDVEVGNLVMSFDPRDRNGRGPLKPRRVTRLYRNKAETFWFCGLRVTPGHHFLTAGGGFATIESILDNDGIVVRADGTKVRARTGHPVGSWDDRPVQVAYRDPRSREDRVMFMRAGTLCGRRADAAGMLQTIGGIIRENGLHLREDGLLEDSTGTLHFEWPWGDVPPPHLELGRRMPLKKLLHWSSIAEPLSAFVAPAANAATMNSRHEALH